MAGDIWRRGELNRADSPLVHLLQSMVFIWSLSTILLSVNAASQVRVATGE